MDGPDEYSLNKSSIGKKNKCKKVYAKRKCEVKVFPHNVVLFKHCLREKEQIAMLQCCADLSEKKTSSKLLPRKEYVSSEKKAAPVLFYNWPAVNESMDPDGLFRPNSLLEFAERMFKKAKKAVNKHYKNNSQNQNNSIIDFPSAYSPDALYAVLYPYGGSFIPHVDGAKGWVLAVSIGDTAQFFVCDTPDSERVYITIESGDAVIFKGGSLYHGVEQIFPDTSPSFWKDSSKNHYAVYNMSRFNIQFRDPVRDRLNYYPHFVAMKNEE